MKIDTRLKELKEEYKKGQERLLALEQEITNLRSTMLRISGAIQVLEELTGEDAPVNSNNVDNKPEITKDTQK